MSLTWGQTLRTKFRLFSARGLTLSTMVVGFSLALSAPAQAGVFFRDILDASPEFLDMAERTLWEMVEELGLKDEVKDLAVVGSMAYGIGRLEDDPDPSDVDFVIITKRRLDEVMKKAAMSLSDAKHVWSRALEERLDSQLQIDVFFAEPDWLDPKDPNTVWYSLTERKMYHRPGDAPRRVYGWTYLGKLYVFDRDEYFAFRDRLQAEKFPISGQVENGQYIIYDGVAWDQGKKVVLIKSFPRVSDQQQAARAQGQILRTESPLFPARLPRDTRGGQARGLTPSTQ